MSAGKMFTTESDEGFIAGRCIPIVPFYGKRWVVDGIERCMGHVRLAKDAQRLKNTLLSWLADMAIALRHREADPHAGADRWARDRLWSRRQHQTSCRICC
jgi:hypothetical protein